MLADSLPLIRRSCVVLAGVIVAASCGDGGAGGPAASSSSGAGAGGEASTSSTTASGAGGSGGGGGGGEKTVLVKIIAFNDFHGNLEPPDGSNGEIVLPNSTTVAAGGAAYLAHHIKKLRAENANSIVVSAGDLIGASPLVSGLFHDEPTILAMNSIGLDLNAVGNHEFDEGETELLRMQNGGCSPVDGCTNGMPFPGASFQFLAANVTDDATQKTIFPRYAIREFDGVKVGFIGMTLEGTAEIVLASAVTGLSFADEVTTVNAIVPELNAKGVNAIVVLVHQGGSSTGSYNGCTGISGPIIDIAQNLSDKVDVVLSGHTHQAYNCEIAGKIVTSAESYGRLLTDVELEIQKSTGKVVKKSAENVIVTRDNADADVASLVAGYEELSAPLANQQVGSITETLVNTVPLGGSGLSEMGVVIADAQLAATSSPGTGAALAAFMNPGGVRAELLYPAAPGEPTDGIVTYGELFAVQPFGNTLVTMTLTGDQIKAVLEQQFQDLGGGNFTTTILQTSIGFEYTYSLGAPLGSKIDFASIRLAGAPIDHAATYRIATNNYLAGGGDGFTGFTDGTDSPRRPGRHRRARRLFRRRLAGLGAGARRDHRRSVARAAALGPHLGALGAPGEDGHGRRAAGIHLAVSELARLVQPPTGEPGRGSGWRRPTSRIGLVEDPCVRVESHGATRARPTRVEGPRGAVDARAPRRTRTLRRARPPACSVRRREPRRNPSRARRVWPCRRRVGFRRLEVAMDDPRAVASARASGLQPEVGSLDEPSAKQQIDEEAAEAAGLVGVVGAREVEGRGGGDGAAAGLFVLFGLALTFAHEAALFDEGEDARELAEIEPGAVRPADVDDDAARPAEVLAVHHRLADRARQVLHRADRGDEAARLRRADRDREIAAIDELAERGVLDELPAAGAAVEHRPRGLLEADEHRGAVRAVKLGVLADGLEPGLASAARAMEGLDDVHVEARRAADRRDRGAAIRAASRILVDRGAAGGTGIRARAFGHDADRTQIAGGKRPGRRAPRRSATPCEASRGPGWGGRVDHADLAERRRDRRHHLRSCRRPFARRGIAHAARRPDRPWPVGSSLSRCRGRGARLNRTESRLGRCRRG